MAALRFRKYRQARVTEIDGPAYGLWETRKRQFTWGRQPERRILVNLIHLNDTLQPH